MGLFRDELGFTDRALVAVNAGVLCRNPERTLIFDSRIGYNNERYDIIDPVTLSLSGEAAAPVYLENTLTLSRQRGETFLILKQIDSISFDRPYSFLTSMPAIERFLAPWVSVRGGLVVQRSHGADQPDLEREVDLAGMRTCPAGAAAGQEAGDRIAQAIP